MARMSKDEKSMLSELAEETRDWGRDVEGELQLALAAVADAESDDADGTELATLRERIARATALCEEQKKRTARMLVHFDGDLVDQLL